MARSRSPLYPSFPLPKALSMTKKVFEQDRRNPIDREVAVKHMGYSGLSGAADKAIASLSHYGLLEKTGKGEVCVSQLAIDILYPDKPEQRKAALEESAYKPQIFSDLKARFSSGHVSEEALKSYLKRENFLDRAINPITNAYLENRRFLEQEEVCESGGNKQEQEAESEETGGNDRVEYGGAKIGDLIQWESQGQLQFEKPCRVRSVSEDGQWVAIDGSETGIPMQEVIVEQPAGPALTPPPHFPMERETGSNVKPEKNEIEWMRNLLGPSTKLRLLVNGEMGTKEIDKLIILLKAQKSVLSDDGQEDAA